MTPGARRPRARREAPERALPRRARSLVVKVGSSVLTDDGTLRRAVFAQLARQVSRLVEEGRQVVLVSSGAIAIGGRILGWKAPAHSIPEKQAAAAIGQSRLVEIYRQRFQRYGRHVAQVLVTRAGLEHRERFLNARRTLATLLQLGVVPIVNENDTVATEEIRFGDNDNLSATVVNLVGADLLVLLTDVDGLYEAPPRPDAPRPRLVPVIERMTPEIRRAAQGSVLAYGRGGMITKLEAAQSAARSGAATVIANGRKRDVLLRVAAGALEGTLFLPGERLASRKHWLAFTTRPRGALVVDDGAARALCERGRSLLSAGIVDIQGDFRIGEVVSCVDRRGVELARGLVAYSSSELQQIRGVPTRRIEQVLGYSNGDEVIHRNDLVVLDAPDPPETAREGAR